MSRGSIRSKLVTFPCRDMWPASHGLEDKSRLSARGFVIAAIASLLLGWSAVCVLAGELNASIAVVDHVRLACSLADPTDDPTIKQDVFCRTAKAALGDLATGRLDSKVAAQSPWSAVLNPVAARNKCFGEIQGAVPAGACDWNYFWLPDLNWPLKITDIPWSAVASNDVSGLTISLRARRLDGEMGEVEMSAIEPANFHASEQRTIEIRANVSLAYDLINQKNLHEELQIVLAKYFTPAIVNWIKSNDISQARSPKK